MSIPHPIRIFLRTVLSLLRALDEVGSAITGGAPGQTISARLGKARLQHVPVFTQLADALDWVVNLLHLGANHCGTSLDAYNARNAAYPYV